jgi:hypothetical protein
MIRLSTANPKYSFWLLLDPEILLILSIQVPSGISILAIFYILLLNVNAIRIALFSDSKFVELVPPR